MINHHETRHAFPKITAFMAAFLILLLSGSATAAGTEDQKAEPKYSKGVKQCMTCHKEGKERPAHEIFFTEMGITGDPASPFAEGNHDCEACHGPASEHLKKQPDGSRLPPPIVFDDRTPVEEQNAVCMNCHNDSGRFHWPGSVHNTKDITRFIARESRSFVLSVSGLMNRSNITPDIPHSELILKNCPETLTNGGSCIAGPEGEWIIEPVINKENLIVATLDHELVIKERHNFDPSGHYARPDVTKLTVDRKRQTLVDFTDL